MDLSKLPRLSNTATPSPGEPEATSQPAGAAGQEAAVSYCPRCGAAMANGVRFCGACGADTHSRPAGASTGMELGAELWFYIIIGLLLVAWGHTFASYAIARLAHRPFHTGVIWQAGPRAGSEVEYPDLIGHPLWSDSSIFLMGITLLLAGASRVVSVTRLGIKRTVLALALALAVVATLYNIYVSIRYFAEGTLPLVSAVLAAFGGFIVYDQLHAWQHAGRPAPR